MGLVLTASCGRLGFPDQTLACDTPTRFQVGASAFTAITVVDTTTGFAMFTTGADKVVRGWTFDFEGSQLAPTLQNVPLATSETGAIGAASSGSELMLSAMYGMPATGTSLLGLDDRLATLGQDKHDGELAATNPVVSTSDGFAFATVDKTSFQVDMRPVTAMGVDVTPAVRIISGSEKPNNVTIAAAGPGYVVAYTASAPNPKQDRLELLDASFNVVYGPVTTSNSTHDAYRPQVTWAPKSDSYLVAWHEKDATGSDVVWIQIRGWNLEAVGEPTVIANHSVSPQVTTDGTGFWVTWKNTTTVPSFLESAHIAPDGTLVPHSITNSGGAPGQWTMLSRSVQPVLVWTETGGSGPDLYFDARCN